MSPDLGDMFHHEYPMGPQLEGQLEHDAVWWVTTMYAVTWYMA